MKKLLKCITLVSVSILISCTNKQKETTENVNAETITIKHLSGQTQVPKHPKNVVILQYGILDTYEELGLLENVKGIPKQEVPHYIAHFEKDNQYVDLGTTLDANVEKLNDLNPDLIIIGSRMEDQYELFSSIAPTINLEPSNDNYWNTFYANQIAIGALYDKEESVKNILSNYKKRMENISKKANEQNKKALIILTNEGRMSVYGEGSRFGIIHDVLGIKPVDKNINIALHGQSVTNEYIKEKNPDIIFVIDRGAALKKNKATLEQFANPLIKQTNAYKNNSIIFLNPDLWYLSGGGLQSFDFMLKEIEGVLGM